MTSAEYFVVAVVVAAAAERLAVLGVLDVFAMTVRALFERPRFALRPWQSTTCHVATKVEQ